jgi:hypothetical protein
MSYRQIINIDRDVLSMVEGLVKKINSDIVLNDYNEAQKDIVLLLQGGNILFKELTGVDYNTEDILNKRIQELESIAYNKDMQLLEMEKSIKEMGY